MANLTNTSLVKAIREKDLLTIALHFRKGIDPNKRGRVGTFPLHEAIMTGDENMASFFLELSKINVTVGHKSNPSTTELIAEHMPSLLGLLADINATSVIYTATYKENTNLLKKCIKNGANVNITNPWGRTPLIRAFLNGDLKSASLLMDANADPNVRDNFNKSCLIYCLDKKYNSKNMWNDSKGLTDIAKRLIIGGAGLNFMDQDMRTPLSYAFELLNSFRFREELYVVIKEMIKRGATC
ncbi:ankyrin repeat domain-containing protein [Cohnella abietis]|uniref:Uncharacterized protein n=1 Tax=Cohnella abietis TaxID=2507935 RepID=A0A3T1CY33_9BACL|nr:ankyrin repeat domain-containing protein [Cohnella abietis]BBI30744.1 hypothetical protein KCTCHS21_01430 [Cohnella abietis]